MISAGGLQGAMIALDKGIYERCVIRLAGLSISFVNSGALPHIGWPILKVCIPRQVMQPVFPVLMLRWLRKK